jgi:hypothetical protein
MVMMMTVVAAVSLRVRGNTRAGKNRQPKGGEKHVAKFHRIALLKIAAVGLLSPL